MSSQRGLVYLIQPLEYNGTNQYKISCSITNDLEKLKRTHRRGTRFIIVHECDNPHNVKRQIKINFRRRFNLFRGNDYFEGNYRDIVKEFDITMAKIN